MQRGMFSKVGQVSLGMFLALGIAGCGGGGNGTAESATLPATEQNNTPDEQSANAPGGLYVGYYQEDPSTNPEDPMPGAFVLNLPADNAPFNGNMFFTYVGCQTTNVGTVSGTKSGKDLSGTWTGTLDGTPQSGPYSGNYNAAGGFYSGVYSNSGGKQFKKVPGCIEYYIGPNGIWEMFPVNASFPPSFSTSVTDTTVSWLVPPEANLALVYVIDPALLRSGKNLVIWQGLAAGNAGSLKIDPAVLNNGKEYVAVTTVFSASHQRLAASSVKFSIP